MEARSETKMCDALKYQQRIVKAGAINQILKHSNGFIKVRDDKPVGKSISRCNAIDFYEFA